MAPAGDDTGVRDDMEVVEGEEDEEEEDDFLMLPDLKDLGGDLS